MSVKIDRLASVVLRPLLVTLLSLAILTVSIKGVSIMSLFSPVEGKSDFQISDLYAKVADNRAVSHCSDDVVVLASDNCSRTEIVNIIEALVECAPAAVGVDVNFQYPSADDSHMLAVLDSYDVITLPLIVSYDKESDLFSKDQWSNSFLTEWLDEEKFSVVNLERSSTWGPVRTFRPYYTIAEMQVPSFPLRVAMLADKEATDAFLSRGRESEHINFSSRIFEVLNYDDVFHEDGSLNLGLPSKVEGKVVLIGDMNNSKDVFPVPHKDKMPGVLIHAHSVDTILSGNGIDMIPRWLNILISVILCYIFAFLHVLIERYLNNGVDFVIRMLQVILMFVLYKIGCSLYIENYYVDMSLALLMIGTSALSEDIFAGIEQIFNYLKDKFKK